MVWEYQPLVAISASIPEPDPEYSIQEIDLLYANWAKSLQKLAA